MRIRSLALTLPVVCAAIAVPAARTPSPQTPRSQTPPAAASSLVERVADTGFIQIEAPSFGTLDARQQALAYWLTQASIAIDPIIYDQLSGYGLREKRLVEGIMSHSSGVAPSTLANVRRFALLFWANRGNHNEITGEKFLPTLPAADLEAAALAAQKNGAFASAYGDLPPLSTAADVKRELSELRASLYDIQFEPLPTAKTPPPGKDIIQASSNTFYRGVTLADLKGFTERFPLNSRVVKGADGTLREEVYRAGTADGTVPPGLYAVFLNRAITYLDKARAVADPAQAAVISDLIRFYQTGDPKDWLQFGADWVRNDATVDFANGFIEVYRDARGAKGSSQSFVTITDKPVTTAMTTLAKNAGYFEQQAPWDPKYKKESFDAPVVKAVEILIETGDFHISTIGDNLPNENEIRERYGSKNFLLLGSSHAMSGASGSPMTAEFAATPEEISRAARYSEQAEDMLTAMHEVIGHGSGKLTERLKGGAQKELKEYYSTLEEARADLMGLYNIWDPKLKALGLVEDQDAVARTMYDNAARAVLTQLRRIPKGDVIEEDHQRARALIANYVKDTTGAIEQVDRDRKTYVRVTDYQKMRQGVAKLLAELMRIKAEGDYAAIKALIDRYGVHFDPKVRNQIVERYAQLSLPTYWAGVNPELTADLDAKGNVTRVTMSYPRDAVHQYLRYGAMWTK